MAVGHHDPVHLDLDVAAAAQDVDPAVGVTRVDDDLLVLLEPVVHGRPVDAQMVTDRLDGGVRVLPGGVDPLLAAGLDREVVSLASAG